MVFLGADSRAKRNMKRRMTPVEYQAFLVRASKRTDADQLALEQRSKENYRVWRAKFDAPSPEKVKP